jgi:hypothetical protein
LLQIPGLDQDRKISILHAAEQRQGTHDIDISCSHGGSLCCRGQQAWELIKVNYLVDVKQQ